MSEQQNIEIVQQAYAAFGRGDIAAVLDRLSDNVDWEAITGAGSAVPIGGRKLGRAQVADFFSTLAQVQDFKRFEPREFFAKGDRVVALGSYEAIVKATGRSFVSDWAMVFTVKNGKVTEFREYTNTAAIVEAFKPVGATV